MTTATIAPTSGDRRVVLTYRGVMLDAVSTLLFTSANVYLGLKVGLTFASSIPAAVISMAVLRGFRRSTIWENNIVQTVASAAGTLSSIIFVLPGLVMIGWWTGFPFWESFGICVFGGILGVMYSVPLRRAMVTGSDLPYPEGVAAADRAVVLREVVREVARASGTRASFAPLLDPSESGNGVHIHLSLLDADGHPALYDPTRPGALSELGGSFAAGVLLAALRVRRETARTL